MHGGLGLIPRNRVKQPEIIMVNTYNQSHCLGSLQVGRVNCPVTLVKWVSSRQVTDTVSKTRWTVPIKHRLTSGLRLYESTNLYLTCKKREWVRRGRERGIGGGVLTEPFRSSQRKSEHKFSEAVYNSQLPGEGKSEASNGMTAGLSSAL